MVEWLFLAVPRGCLRFVIVLFPDHTHLLFFKYFSERQKHTFVIMRFKGENVSSECMSHSTKVNDKQCGPRSVKTNKHSTKVKDKQCRTRSDRSSLIWVHNVCLHAYVK